MGHSTDSIWVQRDLVSCRKASHVSGSRSKTLEDSQVTTTHSSVKTPNFLIIGAAKSGTTAVWHYLRQHPEIYMSPTKHTRFFAFEVEEPSFQGPAPTMRGPAGKNQSVPYAITDIDAYHALFDGATCEIAIGEASHSYLYQPQAAQRIRNYSPEMKLIAILRNPAERAFSHYRQMVRDGRELIPDFAQALAEEEARVRDDWWPDFHYIQTGLYYAQLKRYFALFERDQLKIYLYEDLDSDPFGVSRDIFRFLGVHESFAPQAAARYNASGRPKSKILHLSLQKLRRAVPVAERFLPERQYRRLLRVGSSLHNHNLTKTRLSPDLRRKAIDDYFREDILRLQALLQRDLSGWLR
jgi:hypothetical protein